MRKLLLLALLTLAPAPVDASCMQASLTPVVLTRRDTNLPADGGVLVGYTYATGDNREDSGPDPSDVKWTATAGKTKIELVRTQLAPGLSVYRPAATVTAFRLATKTKDHGSFTHATTGAATAMAAPKPHAVKTKSTHNERWSTSTSTLVLDAAAPADAVAIIAYDTNGKPLLFATLPDTHDKLLEFEIDSSGGHCGTLTPPEHSGLYGKIAFAYVDAFGRLSAQSKPISAQ